MVTSPDAFGCLVKQASAFKSGSSRHWKVLFGSMLPVLRVVAMTIPRPIG
jgi:hypothetical protein